MTDVYAAWQALIDAMLAASKKTSDVEMSIFNTHGKSVNEAVSRFITYHHTKGKK